MIALILRKTEKSVSNALKKLSFQELGDQTPFLIAMRPWADSPKRPSFLLSDADFHALPRLLF